jgi:TldD protein
MNLFESDFGITDACLSRVLSACVSRGADFAELYFEQSHTNYLVLEDGIVSNAYARVELGVGVRAVVGDQTGYAFTQELTEASMLKAAEVAASIALRSSGAAVTQFVRPRAPNYYPLSRAYSDVMLSEKLPKLQELNRECFNRSSAVVKVSAFLFDNEKHILIARSDGQMLEDTRPLVGLGHTTRVERGQRREESWASFGGRFDIERLDSERMASLAHEGVDRAVCMLDAVQGPAGEMPVVLGPGRSGALLHEAIGHGMEADCNRQRISTFSTMLGKAVSPNFVTIVDDGTNPENTGALNFDDEGSPSRRTVLVENGILTGYLHDRISAAHYGVAPTGNGRRESYQHYPVPRMRNTYMLPGTASPEDVIGAVKRGLYVPSVTTGAVRIGEGDFSFYVDFGYLIEDGRLTAPVKDVNIIDNGPKMLGRIVMLANDLEFDPGGLSTCGKCGQLVPVGFGMPTCLVESMTVGGVEVRVRP